MNDWVRDLKFGLRQLLRAPGFTLAAVLCLGLGIGANSAAFSFVQGLLFQRAPIRDPETLARLYLHYADGPRFGSWSIPDIRDLKAQTDDVMLDVMSSGMDMLSLSAGRSQRLFGAYVTGNYFDFLGVTPALGRGFLQEEDATVGSHPVAVIGHGLWQRIFGGDADVVGRTLSINGHELTVVGVTAPGFTGHDTAIGLELWIPLAMEPTLTPGRSRYEARGSHWLQSATVRLAPGGTPAQAEAVAEAMFARLAQEYPETNAGITIDSYAESEAALHPAVRGGFVAMLSLLSAVTAFILLLACANVAGLLLARATARRREIGIRLAVGAGRGRLVRQLLTESLLLSLLAGAVGVGLGALLIRTIGSFQPPTSLPIHIAIGIDATVLAFSLGVSVLTGTIFGLAPALQVSRQQLVDALRDGAPGSGGQGSRLRSALVVGQVALCMLLLVAAGVVLRSLGEVRRVDVGLDPTNLVTANVDPALEGYSPQEIRDFYDELRADLAARPGVAAVGLTESLPLRFTSSQRGILPEGWVVPEGSDNPYADYSVVDAGFFAAAGVPILRGRAFGSADGRDGAPVMIVNEALVDRYWPGETGVGKTVETSGVEHTVVGVVATGKYFSLGEDPKPFMYLPYEQRFRGDAMNVLVRTRNDPSTHLETLRAAVARLDPTLPVADLETMTDGLGMAYLPARLAAGIVGAFAVLALLLAAVGLYGVISFHVARDTHEIGVRMALGARPRDVVSAILARGMRMALVGVLIGAGAGALLTRMASGVLYGVSGLEPTVTLAAFAVLLTAALIATLLPARRATRIDPLSALRAD